MREPREEPSQSLPCPTCDYDLQGQVEPQCPECGRRFSSIAELRALALDAMRLFNRVLEWRLRFAWAYAAAIGWMGAAAAITGGLMPAPSTAATIMFLVAFLPLTAMPLLAGLFFVQVLRIRMDSRIGRLQRRQLNGTFPLLIVYMLPGLVFIPLVLSMLLMRHVPAGAGI